MISYNYHVKKSKTAHKSYIIELTIGGGKYMNGFDVTQIPLYFLLFQVIVVGFFVLIHFFMGMKRGVVKTAWFFLGQVVLVVALLWSLGQIQTVDFINEAMVRQYSGLMSNFGFDLNQYMDQIVASGSLPLFLAIMDLSFKISMFIMFYTILRFIFQWIVFGIPWLFIKPAVKGLKKQRLLGGVIGIARGAFSGFIIIFPILILINTVVGQGVEIENSEYQELAVSISEANDYNFVGYINDAVKVGEEGLADFMFDMAFRSKVNGEEVIVWRAELEWIAEAAKLALPYVIGGEEFSTDITVEQLESYDGFFTSFAKSQLINSSLKPIIKLGLLVASDMEGFDFLTDEEIEDMITRIDDTSIDLVNDVNELYLAAIDLLTIQTVSEWEAAINTPSLIAGFNETNQDLFIGALSKMVSLDLLKLGDIALEIGMYNQTVMDNISWLDTPEEKVAMLDDIRNAISTYDGEFISTTLSEIVTILDTTFFDFPGIDLDNDSIVDVDLIEFIDNISDLTVILNKDTAYHAWFREVITEVSNLSVIDVFMGPIMDFGVAQLTNTEAMWTEEEMNLIRGIIETNFETSTDLQRELLWMADVYQTIGELGIASNLSDGDDPIDIIDSLLVTQNGQLLFKDAIDTFLDGQTISALTTQMSDVLIKKYLTEPLELVEPLNRALDLDSYNFNDEVSVVIDVLFGLYDEGLILSEIMAEDADMFQIMLPVLLDFVSLEANKDLLLSSNIMYAFIDSNLGSIEGFDVPSVAYEATGEYEGWIKKSELSAVFEIFGGLVTEIENQGLEISVLFSGGDMINTLFPVIKAYVADPVNRTLLLSSDILYSTLNQQMQDLDAIEVPSTALVNDALSDYNGWIVRTELEKLLEAIVVLDLSLPSGSEPFDLSGITGAKVNEVIGVESLIITRLLSSQIKDANIFDIPDAAFTTIQALDLRQEELEALGQLLEDLEIDLGAMTTGGGSGLLDDITVSKLTGIQYTGSFIMKGFITYGIKTGIGDPHSLAMDTNYPEILSEVEIGEVFNILNALDEVPSMSITDLTSNLTPDSLTFNKVNEIIQAGDSIVIRALVSDSLFEIPMITNLTIQDSAYHEHNGNPVNGLISYLEMQNMIQAMSHLATSQDAPIMDAISDVDMDFVSLGNMIDMIGENSIIVKTLMSNTIIDFVTTDKVVDAAYDINNPGDLTQTELLNFFEAIAVLDTTYDDGNPNNDQSLMNVVTNLAGNTNSLTIGQMIEMHQENSLIMRMYVSEGIITAVGSSNVRDDAYEIIAKSFINYTEIDNLLSTLHALGTQMNSGDANLGLDESITDVASSLTASVVTPSLLTAIANDESIIAYRMTTNAIVTTGISIPILALQVHAYTGNDLTKTELINLADAVTAFGLTNLEVNNIHPGTTALSDVSNALDANSLIVNRLISQAVVDANLDTVESHIGQEDVLVDIQHEELKNLVEAFIDFGITDIDNALTTSVAVIYANAQSLAEAQFNIYIGYEAPYDPLTEDLGLTIVKDFLIDRLDNTIPNPSDLPNNYPVTNRQELNDLIY